MFFSFIIPGQDYLYWGDSEHGTITRIHRDGTGREVVIGHLDNADVSHVMSDWFSGITSYYILSLLALLTPQLEEFRCNVLYIL